MAMPTTVVKGMTTHSVGVVSFSAECSIMARKPITRKMTAMISAAARKNSVPMMATAETTVLWVMAAEAEKPTPIMAKAKTDSIWPKELFFWQVKPPAVSTRPMKSAKMRSA